MDIAETNEGMRAEKLNCAHNRSFAPTRYEAKQEFRDEKTVWFHSFETMRSGELRNVDV